MRSSTNGVSQILRDRARELRIQKHLSIEELAERLALPKTTIYYWVKDVPLGPRAPRVAPAGHRGHAAEVSPSPRGRLRAVLGRIRRAGPAAHVSRFRRAVHRGGTSAAGTRRRWRTPIQRWSRWPRGGCAGCPAGSPRFGSNITPIRTSECFEPSGHRPCRGAWRHPVSPEDEHQRASNQDLAMRPRGRRGGDPRHAPTRAPAGLDGQGIRMLGLDSPRERGVAQPGSAPPLGGGGPRFKSGRPDLWNPCLGRGSRFLAAIARSLRVRIATRPRVAAGVIYRTLRPRGLLKEALGKPTLSRTLPACGTSFALPRAAACGCGWAFLIKRPRPDRGRFLCLRLIPGRFLCLQPVRGGLEAARCGKGPRDLGWGRTMRSGGRVVQASAPPAMRNHSRRTRPRIGLQFCRGPP
jgi:hypothetical protein